MAGYIFSGLLLFSSFISRTDGLSNATPGGQVPLVQSTTSHSALLDLHQHLIEIESTSGNEGKVGDFLVSYLESLNLTVHKQALAPLPDDKSPRFNVHAYPGSRETTRTLLTSHIDTVPPYWPYERRKSGKEIWGRGSVDAKACVAAQVQAYAELSAAKTIGEGDVGLLFVVGEETTGDGMVTANDLGLEWEAVVFGEPTEGKLVSGHKGLLQFTINVQGVAAHSGYPWLGQSANDIMIAVLAALKDLEKRNGTENGGLPWSEKYGATTVNVGKMSGGVAGNVVAESAEARLMVRLAGGTPKESLQIFKKTIEEAALPLIHPGGEDEEEDGCAVDFLEKSTTKKPHASISVRVESVKYGPVHIDADIDGFEVMTVNYGTDVVNLKGKHKRYLYGPGSIFVAHSDHEHLKTKELEQAVQDYKKIVTTLLER